MSGIGKLNIDRFKPSINTLVLGSIAMCLAVAGGFTNYRDRLRLTSDRVWVEHTHDVIREVHSTKYQVNITEGAARLYDATHKLDDLRRYGEGVANIDSNIQKIEALTWDNKEQQEKAVELRRILEPLRADAALPLTPGSSTGGLSLQASTAIHQGVGLINEMGAEEYRLLVERNRTLTNASERSSVAALIYLSLSTVIVLALQLLLMRHFRQQKLLEARMSIANGLLKEKITESEALVYASNELSLCTEPKEAHNALTSVCARLIPRTSGAIALINNSRQIAEVCASWGRADNLQKVFSPDGCCALRSGRLRQRKPDISAVDCKHFEDGAASSYVCIPLSAQGETLGMLYIDCREHEDPASLEQSIKLIQDVAEFASITIANLNLREKLRNQSIRDGLTGLFNRSFMEVTLEREIRRAARHDLPLSLIMLDVDHFKNLNDSYGHVTGDQALQRIAFILQQAVRAEDVVCRYGGEEFVLILPNMAAQPAFERAELLRTKVRELHLMHEEKLILGVTISLGVATFPADGRGIAELLRAADSCLYRAKNAGRNQTVFTEVAALV